MRNLENLRVYQKKYYQDHKKELVEYARQYKASHKKEYRSKNMERSYGITLEEYNKMVKNQNGKCAICGTSPKETLTIDHDHNTGKVRQLLCRFCNAALGLAKEDINILESMIKYIHKHEK